MNASGFPVNGAMTDPVDVVRHKGEGAKWPTNLRPVDVKFDPCGRLYFTSDKNNEMYVIGSKTKGKIATFCNKLKKQSCNFLRNRKQCMWTGSICQERMPTRYPTAEPTKAPTPFSCSVARSLQACRSLKFRKRCVYASTKQCVERTAFPTRSPTTFSCGNAKSLRTCRSLKFRKRCVYAKKQCVERTAFPTRSPTIISCRDAKSLRACRSLKFRKKCVFFNKQCVE